MPPLVSNGAETSRVAPMTAPNGLDHTIRQAAFEYSVMPFSSYV